MRYDDIIQTTNKEELSVCHEIKVNQKSSFIRILHSDVIPIQASGLIVVIMFLVASIASGELAGYIRRYGKMLMGQFHQGFISTIGTKTRLITLLKTLNVSQLQTTMPITFQPIPMRNWRGVESGLIGYGQQLLIGMVQKRAMHGIKNLGVWPGKMSSTLLASVQTVAQNFSTQLWATKRFTVLTIASLLHAVNRAWITSNAPVQVVEKSLQLTDTAEPSAVLLNVLNNCEEVKNQTVYISVDPVGEVFPIGIFVYDEDTDRYFCARHDLRPSDVRYSNRIY